MCSINKTIITYYVSAFPGDKAEEAEQTIEKSKDMLRVFIDVVKGTESVGKEDRGENRDENDGDCGEKRTFFLFFLQQLFSTLLLLLLSLLHT